MKSEIMRSENKSRHWHAVLVGSKKEKFVFDLLQRKGISVYLPLVKRTRRYASRIKTHEVPLISCYVFVQVSEQEHVDVLETAYVYKFIRFGGNITAIPQHEIDILKHVVGHYDDVELADDQLYRKGDKVELIAGELTGIKGTVIEDRGNKRYLVKLESLDLKLTWTVKASKLKRTT